MSLPAVWRRTSIAAAAAASVLVLSACEPLGQDTEQFYAEPAEEGEEGESVELLGPDGEEHGTVELVAHEDSVELHAELTGLTGEFHGFHVHTTGECEPDSADPEDPSSTGDFLSAGGHLAASGEDHGDHTGDLPSLRVAEDGTATLQLETDAFTMADLADDDGSALMVHAGPDNFANIPERYAPEGPDDDTLSTGDAGDRIACGVIEAGR